MGYRQTSNYEPYGTQLGGRPKRPFNRVQWAGVAFAVFGIALDLLYFTGRLGWTPAWIDSPAPAMPAILLGILLVNSRREGVTDLAPELAAQRKRWLLITVIICAVVLGAAAIIQFSGA